MRDQSIAGLSIDAMTQGFRAGVLSPVIAVEENFARIDASNPSLNAFLDLRREAALAEALQSEKRWKQGAPLSLIDGVPFGVKANIAVKGLPWHGGVGAYGQRIAGEDAACVSQLKQAGAIALGILNMHEGALGATTDNSHFGRCRNPWDLDKTPGGSSGGSGAAVAAGLCTFALGTDTMGSVRIPSAYCGVAGLKPTIGTVADEGLINLSWTLDHIGPHARHADDLRRVMSVFLNEDDVHKDRLLIGVADWGDAVNVEAEIAADFMAAADKIKSLGDVERVDLSSIAFGALRRRGLLVSEVEGAKTHAAMLEENPDGFSQEFRNLLQWGAHQAPEKIAAAYKEVKEAGEAFALLFDHYDIIITPTAPQGPFSFDDQIPANQADFTALANFAGCPALALPAAIDGAPPGSIQFISAKGGDGQLLAFARHFETLRGALSYPAAWH